MRIHALQTGSVAVKQSFLHARTGIRRRLDLVLPGPFSEPLPIHAWLIEHDGQVILIDAGETANPKDPPFARSQVSESDELPHALAAAGFGVADITTALITHMHPDHYQGAKHLTGQVLVPADEYREITSRRGRIQQKLTGAPLPSGPIFEPVELDHGPFGAFAASRRITGDGRVMLVGTPGHTRGHTSVVAIDDDGTHILLAADATDSLEQLHDRRADAIGPDQAVHVRTLETILAHTREHPTVYLPSHDPESVARLGAREVVAG